MKTRNCLWTAALALAFATTPLFAQAGGGGGGGGGGGRGGGGGGRFGAQGPGGQTGGFQRGGNPYANQDALMEQSLKLTDDQKPKIKDKIDAMNKELDAFETQAADTLRQGQGGRGTRGGGGGGGGATPGGMTPEDIAMRLRSLIFDYQKLVATHQAAIDAELTDDQRASWEALKIERALQGRLLVVGLSSEQNTRVHELTAAAGKEIAALKDLTDVAAVEAVQGRLAKKIVNDVLTEGQASLIMGGAALPPLLQTLGGGQGGRGGAGRGNFGGGGGGGQGGGAGGGGRRNAGGGAENAAPGEKLP